LAGDPVRLKRKKEAKYIFPPYRQVPEPRLPDPGWDAATGPVAVPGWDRDDLSWAFPGFPRAELEQMVDAIQTGLAWTPRPGMRVYLSGPMKGKPLHNFPKFTEVAAILRGFYNLEVLSPHEIPSKVARTLTREEYLKVDLYEMLDFECEGIVMMDNWLDSWGACFELNVAAKLGFQIFLWDNKSAEPRLYNGEALRYYVR
jgi:hypothetical protein